MIKKSLLFGFCQIIIGVIFGVYVESVSAGKLLFMEGVLAPGLIDNILKNPWIVLSILILLNLLIYYLIHKNTESEEKIRLHSNICQLIFDNYIKPDGNLENSKFRVSTFRAQKKLIFRRKKYFLPEYRTVLSNIGRYQTRQEKKRCRVDFLPDEGAVGICYSIGEFVFKEIPKFDSLDKQKFLKNQVEELKVPQFKAKKLNDKSCSYVCCPIKHFKDDTLYGVVVVDSTEAGRLKNLQFRHIESTLEHYSVFFNNNKLW